MGDVVGNVELGMKIKLLRQQAGLSQEKLAEMIGLSFQQVQKYENGHTTLNILKLQQIALALRVQVSDFLSSAPTQHVRLTGEEDKLLQSFRRIKNVELRDSILKLVGNVNKRAK